MLYYIHVRARPYVSHINLKLAKLNYLDKFII